MEKWADDFAGLLRDETKNSVPKKENFIIGTVVSPSPNLKISDGPEIIIEQEDLYILENVAANYEREVTYEQSNGTSTGTLRFTDTLKNGDQVALIPSGGDVYLLLGKVVQL